uniref:Putative secreted protein n=1 Tax=Anopheles darlingi TaxID=43151 RepID=A0A2M4DAE7_ANODA
MCGGLVCLCSIVLVLLQVRYRATPFYDLLTDPCMTSLHTTVHQQSPIGSSPAFYIPFCGEQMKGSSSFERSSHRLVGGHLLQRHKMVWPYSVRLGQ